MFKRIISVLLLMSTLTLGASTYDKIYDLSREKSALTREALKLLRTHHVDPNKDPAYKAAQKKALLASQNFLKVRGAQPELKALLDESQKAMSDYMKASRSKDKSASKAAMKRYQNALREVQKKGRNIPAVVKAQKEAQEANKKAQQLKLQLIAQFPEGKNYLKKIDALDAKIAALQKKL